MRTDAPEPLPPGEVAATLCPACGLCCNGVVFADVQLRPEDDREQLRELGLPLFAKGGRWRFGQPCVCWDGRFCRIYAQRPAQCRAFECRLFQQVSAGTLSANAALLRIARALQKVAEVRRLLRQLGDTDETSPLSRRYARIMTQPIDFGGDEEVVERRSALLLAVDRLARTLARDFLTPV